MSKIEKIIDNVENELTKELINTCMDCATRVNQTDYKPPKEVTRWKKFTSSWDIEGLYGTLLDEDAHLIAFGGTDSAREMLLNMNVLKKNLILDERKYSRIKRLFGKIPKVHAGFYAGYESVSKEVIDSVTKAYRDDKGETKFIVTGYSLGGALATLCAYDIAVNYLNRDVLCITFGSPRVGNRQFVKEYKENVARTIRVVNGFDIVPRVPLWIMGFRHNAKRYQIGEKNYLKFFTGSILKHLSYSEIK